mgnify:CR=1 FL=1
MNRIPKTEISVSPVTLGTMTFGSPVAFDDAVKLTQYALSQGINHIDTANMYEGYNRVAGSAGAMTKAASGNRRPTRSAPGTATAAATRPPEASRNRSPPAGQPVRPVRWRAAQPSQNAASPLGRPRVTKSPAAGSLP